ncbi:MAG: cytochrome c5 family protein [Rhodocyclaceae bacterium]|jgi:cytochrome c5|nr:cytochrome c5 family protein [Rhodocyclaceae bacterium]
MADKNSSSKIMYLSIALAVILMAVVVPFSMSGKGKSDAISNADDVESRIAPVAKIELQAGGGAGGVKDGKTVYNTVCAGCHGAGVMGAPKMGDKGAWGGRIGQGMATLNAHAINGFKGMPARGGAASLSDDEVKAAVQYMVDGSK